MPIGKALPGGLHFVSQPRSASGRRLHSAWAEAAAFGPGEVRSARSTRTFRRGNVTRSLGPCKSGHNVCRRRAGSRPADRSRSETVRTVQTLRRPTQHVAAMPTHMTTAPTKDTRSDSLLARRWPWLLTVCVLAVQAAQIGTQSLGEPGFGTDFQLLYAAAAAWGQQENPYDDTVIKKTWRARGDPSLPEPGRPTTPNVYPLTVAPLIWPLTLFSFHTAILLWIAVVMASEGYLLMHIFRSAQSREPGRAVRRIPVAVAVVILMLCYPIRLNLASLNIGMITGALALAALRVCEGPCPDQRRGWTRTGLAGVAMGLSLIKYSVTGPLLLLMVWRRQFRAASVAIAVQGALILTATWVGGYRHPIEWADAMSAEISHSMAPGEINAHDAKKGAPMHLHLRSLWHRLLPNADTWHWPVLAGLMVFAVGAALAPPPERRAPGPLSLGSLQAALILVAALVAFYHRAYDLVPAMTLVLGWLVRPRASGGSRYPLLEAATWGVLALTVIPGLWHGWDAATAPALVRWFVQPACAWATVLLIPLCYVAVRRATVPTP